jgi:hypothetical protein
MAAGSNSRTSSLIAHSSGERLLKRLLHGHLFASEPAARNVFKIKIPGRLPVRIFDFEAAGLWHRFVLDYADRHGLVLTRATPSEPPVYLQLSQRDFERLCSTPNRGGRPLHPFCNRQCTTTLRNKLAQAFVIRGCPRLSDAPRHLPLAFSPISTNRRTAQCAGIDNQ